MLKSYQFLLCLVVLAEETCKRAIVEGQAWMPKSEAMPCLPLPLSFSYKFRTNPLLAGPTLPYTAPVVVPGVGREPQANLTFHKLHRLMRFIGKNSS